MSTETEKLFYALGEEKAKKTRIYQNRTFYSFFKGTERESFYAFSPTVQNDSFSFEKALWDLDAFYSESEGFAKNQII